MTLRLSDEQLEIRALAREFAQGEIRPLAGGWDARRELDPAVFRKLGELGFLGMRIPESFGGLDLDLVTYLLVLEELSWGDASVALSVAIHSGPVPYLILKHGSEEQKRRFLPAMATGEILSAFALSESGAGSDARALETEAVRDGSDWILSGTKKWVTNGTRAGLILTFARGADGKGIHAFLLDPETPGVRIGRREVTMGVSAVDTVEVHLEDVRLGADALLGEAGSGFDYALDALDLARLGIAAQALGIGRAALEHARAYSKERVQFGKRLAELQATRFKLAGMATRLTSARSLTLFGAECLADESGSQGPEGDGRRDPEAPSARSLSAMAKAQASEAAVWIADEAVQIFGGYGYMKDYPVEKLLRDAKGTEIYEGTNEIMKLVIARELLRDEAL